MQRSALPLRHSDMQSDWSEWGENDVELIGDERCEAVHRTKFTAGLSEFSLENETLWLL